MKFLIVGENFSGLQPWLYYDHEPRGMPAVYNLFKYLGKSDKDSFNAIIFNKKVNRIITFPNGSTIRLYKLWGPTHYLWKLISFFKAYLIAKNMLSEGKYDLIYTMSFYNLLCSIIRRQSDVFTVSRKYGNQMYAAVENRMYWKIYTRFIFVTLAFKYPAHLTIVTKDGTQSAKLASFFNPEHKVYSLYNGMDVHMKKTLLSLPVTKKLPENRCLKIVCIARLDKNKRQDLAIEIIEILAHKFDIRNVQLDLIGEGSQEESLSRMIKKKGLEDSIQIMPAVPHRDIPKIISKYDLCLFCYDKGVMGNILWECMLGGRLILVRASGDATIFNSKNTIKIADSPRFQEEAAAAIASLLGKNVSQICTNARVLASDLILDWETRFELELDLILDQKESLNSL